MSLLFQRRKALSLAGTILLLGAGLAAAPLLADDHELPSAEEIRARHIDAVGGEKALRAHTSRTVKGTFEMPAMGMSGPTTSYAAVNITMSDYKEFGAVMLPTSTSMNMVSMGMEMIQTVESVTFDDVDPSVFEPSDAIKAMLPE